MRVSREQALKDAYDEVKQLGIKIVPATNLEIKEYMDHAANRQGIRPETHLEPIRS